MNKSLLPAAVKIAFLSFFILLSFGFESALGQNIVSNTADPSHETLSQRVISVLFDTNIATATTAAGQSQLEVVRLLLMQ